MFIDLQLHSTYSDGYLTPTQLAKLMNSLDIKVASLTDHNTVGGLEEFSNACKRYDIKAINGLELYVKYKRKKMNILLYNFNDSDPALHKVLRESQIRRRRAARKSLEILVKRGFTFNINKLLDKYTHYVPINHIVDDLISDPKNLKRIKKELKTESPREGDVISHYFKNKEVNILRESYINIERIFELRKKIGGQVILNHPAKKGYINVDIWKSLKNMGLDGVETLSPHHSLGSVMYIQYLAREIDLIETGGSDFHRFEGFKYPIQSSVDYFKIDSSYLKGINTII